METGIISISASIFLSSLTLSWLALSSQIKFYKSLSYTNHIYECPDLVGLLKPGSSVPNIVLAGQHKQCLFPNIYSNRLSEADPGFYAFLQIIDEQDGIVSP